MERAALPAAASGRAGGDDAGGGTRQLHGLPGSMSSSGWDACSRGPAREAGPGGRIVGGIAVLGGGLLSIIAAYSLWFPTYQVTFSGPPPGGGCVCSVHLIGWPVFAFWLVGAVVPAGVFLRPSLWAAFVAVTSLVGVSVAGYLVWLLALWAPFPPGLSEAPRVATLLGLVLVGFGAQVFGLITLRASRTGGPEKPAMALTKPRDFVSRGA